MQRASCIQCKGGSCDCFLILFILVLCGVAIFVCDKLPLDGCELVLVIHRSRAAIDT